MDYKEKYEIGLKGIQEILGSGEDSIKMSRLKLRLQGIFPELKESEDERIRHETIELLETANHPNVLHRNGKALDFTENIDWLKSLCLHKQWKPSDEQLKALKEACDEHWEPDGLDPLYTLYQDLKKLREE